MQKIVEKYGEERVCAWVQSSIGCRGYTARATPKKEKMKTLQQGSGQVVYRAVTDPLPEPAPKKVYRGLLGTRDG